MKYLSKIVCEVVNSIRQGFKPCLLCIEYEREDSQQSDDLRKLSPADELLSLQSGPEGHSPAPSNHEMHFIVTHQAFELWFKQINRELEDVLVLMDVPEVDEKQIPVIEPS